MEVSPKIISDLSSFILDHPQATQEDMRAEIIRTSSTTLSRTSISFILRNIDITCERIAKYPEGNTDGAVSMRIEWACTFNESRDVGCQFLFIDESGLNVSLGRGRGYAGVGVSPSVIMPPKGPNITLIAPMGSKSIFYTRGMLE